MPLALPFALFLSTIAGRNGLQRVLGFGDVVPADVHFTQWFAWRQEILNPRRELRHLQHAPLAARAAGK